MYTGRMVRLAVWGRRERILAALMVGTLMQVAAMMIWMPRT